MWYQVKKIKSKKVNNYKAFGVKNEIYLFIPIKLLLRNFIQFKFQLIGGRFISDVLMGV